jgi:hypothetical protein
MKNRRIGQFVGRLANLAKLADPLVQYTRIRESARLANPVLQYTSIRQFDELAISVLQRPRLTPTITDLAMTRQKQRVDPPMFDFITALWQEASNVFISPPTKKLRGLEVHSHGKCFLTANLDTKVELRASPRGSRRFTGKSPSSPDS